MKKRKFFVLHILVIKFSNSSALREIQVYTALLLIYDVLSDEA